MNKWEVESDGRHQKEEAERDWRWWTWLCSLPAEELDLRLCGRLQDLQPSFRQVSADNASSYSKLLLLKTLHSQYKPRKEALFGSFCFSNVQKVQSFTSYPLFSSKVVTHWSNTFSYLTTSSYLQGFKITLLPPYMVENSIFTLSAISVER